MGVKMNKILAILTFLFENSAAICNFFKLIKKAKNRWSKLKGQLVTKPQCKKEGLLTGA